MSNEAGDCNDERTEHEALMELLREAEDKRTARALVKGARNGILDTYWDEDENCYKWRLSELGESLFEEGGDEAVRGFLEAAERPGLDKSAIRRSIYDG